MNNEYTLLNWNYINDNKQNFIDHLTHSHESLVNYGIRDSTFKYTDYNIFAISSPSIHMYKLYYVIRELVRNKLQDENHLWIQSWLNFHTHEQVLGWHNHDASWHGYVSIEPQDTFTEFENWKIDNKCGNIYFGPGHNRHRVVNNSKYTGLRITIAFDIMTERDCDLYGDPTHNFGCMPFL